MKNPVPGVTGATTDRIFSEARCAPKGSPTTEAVGWGPTRCLRSKGASGVKGPNHTVLSPQSHAAPHWEGQPGLSCQSEAISGISVTRRPCPSPAGANKPRVPAAEPVLRVAARPGSAWWVGREEGSQDWLPVTGLGTQLSRSRVPMQGNMP